MATALDCIKAALRRINVLAAGETPAAEDAADGLEALNDMLHGFMSEGIQYAHTTLATTADTLNMPDQAIWAVKALLALRLVSEFEREAAPALVDETVRGREYLRATYLVVDPAAVDPGLLRMSSQMY